MLLRSGELIQSDDQFVMFFERISTRRGLLELRRKDAEIQSKLLVQLVSPLFDQTTGCDDHYSMSVSTHDEFANIEARHDRLARTGIVSQDKPERLPGKH